MRLPFTLPRTLPGDFPTTTSPGGGSDGTLSEVADFCEDGRSLILGQYKESPLLLGLLCSYLHPYQDLDHAITQVYERALDIDDGEGGLLNIIGRIVREARDGRSDPDYRRGLRTRILINRSQGRIPDLIGILRLFEEIGDEVGAYIRIRQPQPCTIEVRSDRTPINAPREVDRRVRRAKAAGVRLHTILLTDDRATAFRLIRAADYPEKSDIGLSAVSAPVTGGHLAHVLDR